MHFPPPKNKLILLSVRLLIDQVVENSHAHPFVSKQRIEQLLQGAREPSAFLQWQRGMLKRDCQEKLPMIERRRLEARIGGEEVALIRQQIVEQNQKAAQLKKEEVI